MIIPVIIAILALTNEFHKLIWTDIIPVSTSIGTFLIYEHGPGTWVNLIYAYPLLLIGMFLMAYIFINSPKIYRFQTAVAVIGIATPLIFNIIYLTGNLPVLIDLTPVAFGITSLLAAVAIFKYQLLNILPVAHKNLFDNMTNGFLVFDVKNKLVELNPKAEKMFSITSRDIGKEFGDIFKNDPDLISIYSDLNADYEILLQNPPKRWVNIQITPLDEDLKMPCGKLIIVTDIDKRKSYEMALKEKQRTFETLISNLPGVVYKCRNDPDWTMEFLSEGCLELTGYHVEDFLFNKKLAYNDIIHPEDKGYVWSEIQKAIDQKEAFELIYRISTADLKEKYVWEQGRFVYVDKNDVLVLEGFISDITDKIKAEKMLKKSLNEKKILLQEIHHRVKNNMQIISSLLNLQSINTEDENVLNLLKQSQSRIKAMALVHEKLYQSKSLASINFAEYVRSLINELCHSHQINRYLLNIHIDIEDIYLDINTAVPCSLIINELISNILKHAFPADFVLRSAYSQFVSSAHETCEFDTKNLEKQSSSGLKIKRFEGSSIPAASSCRSTDEKYASPEAHNLNSTDDHVQDEIKKGNVYIGFSKEDDVYKLVISDDGIGIPPTININDTKTLGLQLVIALVNQLNGTIDAHRDFGTEFIISFINQGDIE